MLKKIIAICLVVVIASSGIFAAGSSETDGSKPLKVGLLPFAGSVPAAYAEEQGWFADSGLNIEIEIFPTGAPMNEAFAAGRIDIAVIGLAGVFAMASGNAVTVMDTNKASGGNGVFVQPDSPLAKVSGKVAGRPNILGSAELLKGKTFLTQLGTGSQNMLDSYLGLFGLTEADVNVIHIETGQDYQALMARKADGSALMVPYSFQAEDEGLVRLGSDEEVLDYMTPDVLLVRKPVMEARRADIVKFVKSYLEAAEVLDADDQLRYEFSKGYFASAGREYTDAALKQDVALRVFITPEYMQRDDYAFGEGMYKTAEFFVEAGKIPEENLGKVLDSLDTSILEEVVGTKVDTYKK